MVKRAFAYVGSCKVNRKRGQRLLSIVGRPALFLMPTLALGASPPAPTPNIQLEMCPSYTKYCSEIPIDDAPAVCQGLIEQNLTNLGGKYEISAPTEDMGCGVDSATRFLQSIVGTAYANPFANNWYADDVSFEIYEIRHQGYEYLDGNALDNQYTGKRITDALTNIHTMQRARTSLIQRFDALQNVFRSELNWPKLATVAPNVWPIAACVANNDAKKIATQQAYDEFENKVAAYGRSPDLAPFAFYRDWYDLTWPAYSISQPDTTCGNVNDALVIPFYARQTEVVKHLQGNLLNTLYTTKALTQRLNDLGPLLDRAEDHMQQAKASFAADLEAKIRKTYSLAVSQLLSASAAVSQLQADKRAFDSRASQEAGLKATLKAVDAAISDNTSASKQIAESYSNAQADAQSAAALASQAQLNVQKAEAAIKAASLQCNGQIYKDCSDHNAKAKYDQKLYQANAIYNAALIAYSQASADLAKTEASRDSLQDQLLASHRALDVLRAKKIRSAHALGELQSQAASFDDARLTELNSNHLELEVDLGELQVIAIKNDVDLGGGITAGDVVAPKPIFGAVSCPSDNYWVVYTDEKSRKIGPVHLSAVASRASSNYRPLAFTGDGIRPGGPVTALATAQSTVEIIALDSDKFVVGDTRFLNAWKGAVYSVPLPVDTNLPYSWPGEVRYAKFDLKSAIVDKKLVWVLDITCP